MAKTATPTIESFVAELSKAAANPDSTVRDCTAIKPGQHARQGDVYVHCISATPDLKAKPAAWDIPVPESTQVALGQTMGSRHCAEGAQVFWPKSKDEALKQCPIKGLMKNRTAEVQDSEIQTMLGPIVVADKSWTLSHPEHAHCTFPAGVYFVSYQFDERTRREVRD
jgi:hypothetical protein